MTRNRPEAGKTGPGPRTASSCIGIRYKAKPPPCFALNEVMTHGEMSSKTETLCIWARNSDLENCGTCANKNAQVSYDWVKDKAAHPSLLIFVVKRISQPNTCPEVVSSCPIVTLAAL